jgi:hypothetical protein
MRFIARAARLTGRILYDVTFAALIIACVALGLAIAFPRVLELATTQGCRIDVGVPGTWRGTLPAKRLVSVVATIVVSDQACPQGSTWAGQYSAVTGDIQVVKGASALTLAHEYGHALLHDLLRKRLADSGAADAMFYRIEDTDQSSATSGLPAWLIAAYREYQQGSPTPFGNSYFGASFGEYFAESFAYYTTRSGDEVSPAMKSLFAEVEKQGR